MENFIFCAVRMIADIFYPIFTLTITILVCFSHKKATLLGVLHPCLHQGITLDTPDPQLQSFLALPKTDAPIFLCIIPCHVAVMVHFAGQFLPCYPFGDLKIKIYKSKKNTTRYSDFIPMYQKLWYDVWLKNYGLERLFWANFCPFKLLWDLK